MIDPLPVVQYVDGMTIDMPCIVDGMPDEVYHADPVPGGSLSHSIAKTIIGACPAKAKQEIDFGRPPKNHYDVGHGYHAKVLGIGMPILVIDALDYKGKAAQEARKEAYATDRIPLLSHEIETVDAMVAALHKSPAGDLFRPDRGSAELSGFWIDEEFGVWRRFRVDWTTRTADGRLALIDLKSTANAHPDAIARHADDFSYYTQDPYYRQGAEALDLDEGRGTVFLFVYQEKDAPHVVTVAEMDEEAVEWGKVCMRKAVQIYAQCRETGEWPAYASDVISVGLPRYTQTRLTQQWRAGALRVPEDLT